MGMCAVTFFCPPMCCCSMAASSIAPCFVPWVAVHWAWLLAAAVALIIGLGLYIDMTIKCTALTGFSRGWAPVNGTGIWVNASLMQTSWSGSPAPGSGVPVFGNGSLALGNASLMSGPPAFADVWWPQPGEGHDGEVLVNFTKLDLGRALPRSWSPLPTAYSGACMSENSADYMGQGILAAIFLSNGASLLAVSAFAMVLKKTVGSCCGRSFERVSQMERPVTVGLPVLISEDISMIGVPLKQEPTMA